MAYMDQYQQFARPAETAPAPVASGFTPLEWNVIALARRDTIASLSHPGRLSRAIGGLFGLGASSTLADPRLEALRRLAVHAWHRGFAVPVSEIARFKLAGFTIDHVETLLASIGIARDRRGRQAA